MLCVVIGMGIRLLLVRLGDYLMVDVENILVLDVVDVVVCFK